MSELLVAERAAGLIEPHDPLIEGGTITWVCMDDRPLADGIHDGLYRQLGGGAHGYGTDVYMALRLDGAALDTPIHHVGSVVAKTLDREEGIRLRLHEGCAAEGSAPGIAQTIVDKPVETFEGTKVFLPGVDYKRDFLPAREVFAAALEENRFHDPQQVEADYSSSLYVPRLPLRKMAHIAEDILVNDRAGTAFNPAEAIDQDVPAYHISYADIGRELYGPTHDIYGRLSKEGLELVSAMRHAAIALNLPRPQGPEHALHLHRVSELGLAA